MELGGEEMTTRVLDLSAQGTAESYVSIIFSPACIAARQPMSLPLTLLYADDDPIALAGAEGTLDGF